jgi:hypothetical protein
MYNLEGSPTNGPDPVETSRGPIHETLQVNPYRDPYMETPILFPFECQPLGFSLVGSLRRTPPLHRNLSVKTLPGSSSRGIRPEDRARGVRPDNPSREPSPGYPSRGQLYGTSPRVTLLGTPPTAILRGNLLQGTPSRDNLHWIPSTGPTSV